MPLRRDASIELYGFRTWDSLLPWDPMSTDMPARVAPLLERDFLDAIVCHEGSSFSSEPEGGAPQTSERAGLPASDRRQPCLS